MFDTPRYGTQSLSLPLLILAGSLAAFNLDAPRHVARFVHKNRATPKPAAALIVSRGEDHGAVQHPWWAPAVRTMRGVPH